MSQPIRKSLSLDKETDSLLKDILHELSPIFGDNASKCFCWFVKTANGCSDMRARINAILLAMQGLTVNKSSQFVTQTNFEFPACAAPESGAVVGEEGQRRPRVVSISRRSVRRLAVREVVGAWVPSFLGNDFRFPFAHLSTGRGA